MLLHRVIEDALRAMRRHVIMSFSMSFDVSWRRSSALTIPTTDLQLLKASYSMTCGVSRPPTDGIGMV